MVTATHAARVVSTLVDRTQVLAALTGGLLAAHKIVGCPAFDREHPMTIPDRVDRDHAYRYAFTCLSEYEAYADERYLDEFEGFKRNGLLAAWVCTSKARSEESESTTDLV
jgi:hypothetical protein